MASLRSPDENTKHGCVLADSDNRILSIGYNGFPRKMRGDSELPRTRPDKYPWMIHAEENALCATNAPLDNATAFVTGQPCNHCMMLLWQHGVRKVVHINGRGWARDEQERGVREEFLRQSGMQVVAATPDLSWLSSFQDISSFSTEELESELRKRRGKAGVIESLLSQPVSDTPKVEFIPFFTISEVKEGQSTEGMIGLDAPYVSPTSGELGIYNPSADDALWPFRTEEEERERVIGSVFGNVSMALPEITREQVAERYGKFQNRESVVEILKGDGIKVGPGEALRVTWTETRTPVENDFDKVEFSEAKAEVLQVRPFPPTSNATLIIEGEDENGKSI